jgi:hypothetical protein
LQAFWGCPRSILFCQFDCVSDSFVLLIPPVSRSLSCSSCSTSCVMGSVFFYCFIIYSCIVQIDNDDSLFNEFLEDVICHGLEGCWQIAEAKKHNHWFEKASVCFEGDLPLISVLNVYVIIAHRTSNLLKYLAPRS